MSNLQKRLLTAAVAVPILVYLFYRGGVWFLVLIEAVMLIGLLELYSMARKKGLPPLEFTGALAALALGLLAYTGDLKLMALGLTAAVMIIFAIELRTLDLRFAITGTAVTLLGVVYVGFLLSHAILLRHPLLHGQQPDLGFFYVIMAIAGTFLADAGAFFAGRSYGKTKLMPRISPGKTWEGVVGGIVGGTLGVILSKLVFDWFIFRTGFPLLHAFILGPLLVAVSILGDLFESMLKRDAGLKDSGTVFPGHGGMLDRLDSILFAIPTVYYYIVMVVK